MCCMCSTIHYRGMYCHSIKYIFACGFTSERDQGFLGKGIPINFDLYYYKIEQIGDAAPVFNPLRVRKRTLIVSVSDTIDDQ